jgi:hypothetical protein
MIMITVTMTITAAITVTTDCRQSLGAASAAPSRRQDPDSAPIEHGF